MGEMERLAEQYVPRNGARKKSRVPSDEDYANWSPHGSDETPIVKPKLTIVTMNTVKREKIDWVWEGVLARRKTHQFSGMPGVGKSTAAIEMGARITRG